MTIKKTISAICPWDLVLETANGRIEVRPLVIANLVLLDQVMRAQAQAGAAEAMKLAVKFLEDVVVGPAKHQPGTWEVADILTAVGAVAAYMGDRQKKAMALARGEGQGEADSTTPTAGNS